jgi:hypothetical protein
MLEKEGIPFEFIECFGYDKRLLSAFPDIMDNYQICYPAFDPEKRVISVIGGFGAYGHEQDKLEIMGLLTPYEKFYYGDSVVGYLTAKNVFKRIKNHYEKESK